MGRVDRGRFRGQGRGGGMCVLVADSYCSMLEANIIYVRSKHNIVKQLSSN